MGITQGCSGHVAGRDLKLHDFWSPAVPEHCVKLHLANVINSSHSQDVLL